MLLKKGIFAWSPELGTNDDNSQDFYISVPAQKTALIQDYKAIEYFIRRHTISATFQAEFVPKIHRKTASKKQAKLTESKPKTSNVSNMSQKDDPLSTFIILELNNPSYLTLKDFILELDFSESLNLISDTLVEVNPSGILQYAKILAKA